MPTTKDELRHDWDPFSLSSISKILVASPTHHTRALAEPQLPRKGKAKRNRRCTEIVSGIEDGDARVRWLVILTDPTFWCNATLMTMGWGAILAQGQGKETVIYYASRNHKGRAEVCSIWERVPQAVWALVKYSECGCMVQLLQSSRTHGGSNFDEQEGSAKGV
jgi:hypothetical protein